MCKHNLPFFLLFVVIVCQTSYSQPPDLGSDLWCMEALDSSVVYLGGDNGALYKTIDGGLHWQKLQPPLTTNFRSMFFLNPDTGWVGGTLGIMARTIDGGQTWQPLPSLTSSFVSSIYFNDPDTGFFCTSVSYNKGYIFRTTNGGLNWQLNDSVSSRLSDIYFCDKDTGYACGADEIILKTTDGGDNWSTIHYSQYGVDYYDIYFWNPSLGWVAGYWGFIDKTEDGGLNWTYCNSNTGFSLIYINFMDANNGWAVGYGWDGQASRGVVIKSTNGGISWQEVLSTNDLERLYTGDFVSKQTGWIAGENGLLRKTMDGGQSWTSQSLVSIEEKPKSIPGKVILTTNYPNPFNPATTIRYILPASMQVTLKIYNIHGQEVETLVNRYQAAGEYELKWQPDGLPSGIYFYQLQADEHLQIKKLVLQR